MLLNTTCLGYISMKKTGFYVPEKLQVFACVLYTHNRISRVYHPPAFYRIKGVDYTAYAYALFLNNGYPSFFLRVYCGLRYDKISIFVCLLILMHSFRKYGLNITRALSSWVQTVFSSQDNNKICAEYMDDEIFRDIREDPDSMKKPHQVGVNLI